MKVDDNGSIPCPGDEVIRDYAADRLDPETAEAFEAHYFACDRCWSELRRGVEIRAAIEGGREGRTAAEVTDRERPTAWRPPRWLAAAAVVALAFVAVWLWRPVDRPGPEHPFRGEDAAGITLRVENTGADWTVRWSEVVGARTYVVELFDQDGFPVHQAETTETTWSTGPGDAVAPGAIRVRVTALDDLRQSVAFSDFVEPMAE